MLAVPVTLAAWTRRAALIVARALGAAAAATRTVAAESATVAVHVAVALGARVAVATAERKIAARAAAAAIAPTLAAAKALTAPGLALMHRKFWNRSWRRRVIFGARQRRAYQRSMPHPAAWQPVSAWFVTLVT